MTISPSYIPGPNQTAQQAQARASALGVGLASASVPPVYAPYITALPGVVAEYGAGPTVVFAHDDGTLTAAQVTSLIAPLVAQQAADAQNATNAQTILAHIAQRQAQVQAWIAANPSGATPTPAMMLVVAEILNGIADVLQGLVSSTSGT